MTGSLRVIWSSFWVQLQESITNSTLIFTLVIQPMLFTVLSIGLYRYGGKGDLSLYAMIGVALIGMWNVNLWTSGFVVFNERRGGTLELLLATPGSLMLVLFGKSLSNSVVSLGAMVITLLTGALLFGVRLNLSNPLGFVGALLLTVLALTTLGLLFATLFVLTRTARNMTQLLNYPIFILSGLTFPITILPLWTRPFSWILAPFWGNQALIQATTLGDLSSFSYLWLVLLTIFYYVLALYAFRKIEYIARVKGGLHLF